MVTWLRQLEGDRAVKARRQQAGLLLAEGEYREAAELLAKLLRRSPGDAELQQLSAEAGRLLEEADVAAETRAKAAEAELLAMLDEEDGSAAAAAAAAAAMAAASPRAAIKSKAQKKRERQKQKQKEQAARAEVSALLDQLGLAEHLPLCLDNEMDICAPAVLNHCSLGVRLQCCVRQPFDD